MPSKFFSEDGMILFYNWAKQYMNGKGILAHSKNGCRDKLCTEWADNKRINDWNKDKQK
ncbi:hypothetical protein [Xenorhabdus mauleonii]|uniref:hypothetical protein n=1 Tax=Xenorhabdus mauleonii TaxID=351675 RepID=UPI0014727F07|nr:hypothetical protein [Xenorhabdus mauleonii]